MTNKLLNSLANKRMVWALGLTTLALGSVLGIAAWSSLSRPGQLATTPVVAQIRITEAGFVPAELVVKAGTKVVWTNATAAPRRVGANPFPERTQLPELDSGVIAPEGSFSFTFTKAGTIGYSDYTSPQLSGSVYIK